MNKITRFAPRIYMIFCMTLSISLIHHLLGHGTSFWNTWFLALIIAAPLAIFFSTWIGPMMKYLNKTHNN